MILQDLQKQIMSKKLDKVLMFFGEEVAIMDEYLNKIYSTLSLDVVHLDSVAQVYSKLVQRQIASKSKIYIVRDDFEFVTMHKQWDKLFSASKLSKSYVILIYSKVDKRNKFYKQNSDRLCEFEKLNPSILIKYVMKLIPGIQSKDAEILVDVCECNFSRIKLECDKINCYIRAKDINPSDALHTLLKEGVIYRPIGDITFAFTDAILLRQKQKTFEYLRQAKQINEPVILTLSVLYNGFRNILMVQGLGADKSEPVKRTGLTPWQVKLAKEKMGRYSIRELVDILKLIRFVEKGIKTGTIDEDVALEYVLVNIL